MFVAPLIINAGFIGIGGLIVKSGFKNLHFYNKIRNLATSKVKSLAAGEVEIKGVAMPSKKDSLLSPIKKSKCVSYNLQAYRWVRSGNNSGWELMYEKTVNRPFYLSDETGYILVNPEGAKIRTGTFSSTQENQLLPEIESEMKTNTAKNYAHMPEFLKKIAEFKIPAGGRYKYDEMYVPEGENIYVLGYTVENSNKAKNPNVQRLTIAKKDDKDFLITDEKEADVQNVHLINALTLFVIGSFLVFFGLIQIFNIADWINFIGGFQ